MSFEQFAPFLILAILTLCAGFYIGYWYRGRITKWAKIQRKEHNTKRQRKDTEMNIGNRFKKLVDTLSQVTYKVSYVHEVNDGGYQIVVKNRADYTTMVFFLRVDLAAEEEYQIYLLLGTRVYVRPITELSIRLALSKTEEYLKTL